MAERRMFAKSVVESDAFLDMPASAQALYFHLGMEADDEGFLNNPKRVQRSVGASPDDIKILIAKRFIIPFTSGVVVLRHWKVNNYIQKDRAKPTQCVDERSRIEIAENRQYELSTCMDTDCIQSVSKMDSQYSIGKNRIEESREETPPSSKPKKEKEPKHRHGEYGNVLLTDSELSKLKTEFPEDWERRIDRLSEYMASTGKSYKSHLATIRAWARRDARASPPKTERRLFDPDEERRRNEETFERLRQLKAKGMLHG